MANYIVNTKQTHLKMTDKVSYHDKIQPHKGSPHTMKCLVREEKSNLPAGFESWVNYLPDDEGLHFISHTCVVESISDLIFDRCEERCYDHGYINFTQGFSLVENLAEIGSLAGPWKWWGDPFSGSPQGVTTRVVVVAAMSFGNYEVKPQNITYVQV